MTIETNNAVNTPAIETKFEVGKTYAAKKTVLFDCQFTMTVIKRTAQFVTFQFDDDEDDIRRRKITCEYGVEKLYIHETNALDGDYEFSAKNVVEVQADETNEPATVAENPATVETPDIFSNETITVGTPAEAMTLIETVANDNFIFNRQTDKHTIRDEST